MIFNKLKIYELINENDYVLTAEFENVDIKYNDYEGAIAKKNNRIIAQSKWFSDDMVTINEILNIEGIGILPKAKTTDAFVEWKIEN